MGLEQNVLDPVLLEDLCTHRASANTILSKGDLKRAILMTTTPGVYHPHLIAAFELTERPGLRQTSQAVQAFGCAVNDLLTDIKFFLLHSLLPFGKVHKMGRRSLKSGSVDNLIEHSGLRLKSQLLLILIRL
jgi:hypothetical protein